MSMELQNHQSLQIKISLPLCFFLEEQPDTSLDVETYGKS